MKRLGYYTCTVRAGRGEVRIVAAPRTVHLEAAGIRREAYVRVEVSGAFVGGMHGDFVYVSFTRPARGLEHALASANEIARGSTYYCRRPKCTLCFPPLASQFRKGRRRAALP